ncbi:MAG: AAA family ATPase, partial [Gammaproteobacteria bacterium]
MLTTLHIENFAVIQTATLKPHHQFTAITGETGAGKSILVDALALLQGARADKSHIQAGKQSARIEGHFNISHNPSAKKWLQNEGLLQGNTCTITRVLDQHGKSRLYINDH